MQNGSFAVVVHRDATFRRMKAERSNHKDTEGTERRKESSTDDADCADTGMLDTNNIVTRLEIGGIVQPVSNRSRL
jgi:hypothetical protein